MPDLTNITLSGLAVIGIVNVIGFFKADLDSRIKFAIALVVAFIVGFVPIEVGSMLLQRIKDALEIAFASSGVYKLAQKVGSE